jgi:hypothetical protein
MTMKDLAISVVIPTFQRRRLVLGAIESALAQASPPTEILVVDDGSTDGTAEAVAARYGERVRLLRQPNRGVSAARNAAIAIARGDVIAFLDSDDRWLPHHLAVVGKLFARHPNAVLAGTHRDFWCGDDAPAAAKLEDLAEVLLVGPNCVGKPSAVAVRRPAVEAAGGFDERLRYGEDYDMFVRLAFQGPFVLISAETFECHPSPNSLLEEGLRVGGYAGFYEWSADRALAALDRCTRTDADALRAAARARRAIGAAATSLAKGDSAETVRKHLAEARRWVPAVDAEAAVLSAAALATPGWTKPEQRLRVASTLRQASRPC